MALKHTPACRNSWKPIYRTDARLFQTKKRRASMCTGTVHSPCQVLTDFAALRPLHDGNESRGHELYRKVPVISFALWSKKWSKPLHRLQT